MPTIGATGVTFTKVAREWRAKYAMDAEGTPANSTALTAAQSLLAEYVDALKALPNAEVTRVVCGGCGDFKVIVNQPLADHDTWKAADYAPEAEFLAKLKAIDGITRVESQEFTMEAL